MALTVEDEKTRRPELPARARYIYEQEQVAKFLATASRDGVPNVALIVSQTPVGEGLVAFGEFMMVKTQSNLGENPKVASLAVTEKLEMAGFKGEVLEWVRSGPYIDKINSVDFFRYNAYAGIHNAAVTAVTRVMDLPGRVSFSTVGLEFLKVRACGRLSRSRPLKGATTPGAICEKFNSVMSIKVVAFMDADGYPCVVPAFATWFRAPGELRFMVSSYNRWVKELPLPAMVALNVVTMDLLTYQVKGKLERIDRAAGLETGVVRVDEVYSSIPPLCGERLA